MEMSFFEKLHDDVSKERLIAVTLTPKKKLVELIKDKLAKYGLKGITSIGAGNALLEMLLSEFVPVSCVDVYYPWTLPEKRIRIQEDVFNNANVKGKGLDCKELVYTTETFVDGPGGTVVRKRQPKRDAYQSLKVVTLHALLFCFGSIIDNDQDNDQFTNYLLHHKYHCVIIIGDETCMPSIVKDIDNEFRKKTLAALEACSYAVSETIEISKDCSVNFGIDTHGRRTPNSTNPVFLWICTRNDPNVAQNP